MYERTIAAATAETATKFRLAEALALDIPALGMRPAQGKTVPERLAEAREAIRQAGGEPRSVHTLAEYRETALWVSRELTGHFRWVPSASFSAHNEARKSRISYADFAARGGMTVDQIRRESGNAGTDGKPAAVVANAMAQMTTAERAAIVTQALADPDVADRAIRQGPDAAGHIAGAQIRKARADAEERRRVLPPEIQHANRRLGNHSAQMNLGQACDEFAKNIAANLPGAGHLGESERFWLTGSRDRAATALKALSDYLESGGDIGDQAAEFLRSQS